MQRRTFPNFMSNVNCHGRAGSSMGSQRMIRSFAVRSAVALFGDPPGDFAKALPCQDPVRYTLPVPRHRNGHCRGLSTGPNAAEGIERIRRAVAWHSDLLQIDFLPRDPDDQELQVASAVICE
jgi:hypothetical protein